MMVGLCADLGQIQFVLSDKTGTLTRNRMKTRRLSIGGVKFGEPVEVPGVTASIKGDNDWLPLEMLR
jgi:P-type E1-E2 ATPase